MSASSRIGWYVRRLGRMSPAEVVWRAEDRARQEAWSRRRFGPASEHGGRRVGPSFPDGADLDALPDDQRTAIVAAADALLAGSAEILGHVRHDMVDPDWSIDPTSGLSFPGDRPAFAVDYRSADNPRNVKQVWELSRHHHLTVLACAWRLTGDERYAARVDDHLRSWWRANPVLRGVNWTSGIDVPSAFHARTSNAGGSSPRRLLLTQ